jgi:hypothetical protein
MRRIKDIIKNLTDISYHELKKIFDRSINEV